MFYTLNTTESKHNIVNYLHNRENHWSSAKLLQQEFQFTEPLLKRLTLEYQLDGHSGCVNCLEWSANGNILASGSDDTHVRIWDPFNHKCLNVITTTHIGNIFSIKFLGDESLIATAAGDCCVLVRSIDDSRTSAPRITCNCHGARVKRLARAPDQPLLFWSASEDGLVIQYDLREPHECYAKSTIFIELPDLKCITVNPTKPHLIAVGASDCFARVYDRRMVRTSNFKAKNSLSNAKREQHKPQDSNCVQYYAPGHLARDSCLDTSVDNSSDNSLDNFDAAYRLAATYMTFDSTGNELLVNMGGEHIYLYDINNSKHVNELTMPKKLLENYKNGDYLCHDLEVNIDTQQCTGNDNTVLYYIKEGYRLMQRNWVGDLYSAARSFYNVMQHRPNDRKVFMSFIECLVGLKWYNEATNWLNLFQKCFPDEVCKDIINNVQMLHSPPPEGERPMSSSGRYEMSYCKCCDEKNCQISKQERELRADARDFDVRFLGHCNKTTDIKEVNYLGANGKYICAGSDDGLIFIWDRRTTEVVCALRGDSSIVNCIQPHPSACYLASSGIDPCIRLWSPSKEDGSVNPYLIANLRQAIDDNQNRMVMGTIETVWSNIGYDIRDEGSPLRISRGPCQPS